MADLVPFWSAPEEPLDCLYIAVGEGRPALEGLVLPGTSHKTISRAVGELGVRGVEGEVLVTASPSHDFRRIACFGVGKPADFAVQSLRRMLRRVLEQAGRNREYQIAVALPVTPRDLEPDDARAARGRTSRPKWTAFMWFRSKGRARRSWAPCWKRLVGSIRW
jgi:hypothetical protein